MRVFTSIYCTALGAVPRAFSPCFSRRGPLEVRKYVLALSKLADIPALVGVKSPIYLNADRCFASLALQLSRETCGDGDDEKRQAAKPTAAPAFAIMVR